jgi:hypothetical protein
MLYKHKNGTKQRADKTHDKILDKIPNSWLHLADSEPGFVVEDDAVISRSNLLPWWMM